jgi:hypothetical protein
MLISPIAIELGLLVTGMILPAMAASEQLRQSSEGRLRLSTGTHLRTEHANWAEQERDALSCRLVCDRSATDGRAAVSADW